MWRLAVLTLITCAGCASNEGYVVEDGILGDLSSRFSPAQRYAPSTPISSPAFYPDMVAGKSRDDPASSTPGPASGKP